jgi:hypothetical protein
MFHFVTAALLSPCIPSAWTSALADFTRARPAATAQDFYKLAHQGTMGSEHAVGTGEAARTWMAREVASLKPAPKGVVELLVEPLPPDGRFVRVNLRPYLARGLSPDSLVAAFIATANTAAQDSAQLVCARHALPAASAARALFDAQRRNGFGAVHHSEVYERAYAPAYRVISRERAARLPRGAAPTPKGSK